MTAIQALLAFTGWTLALVMGIFAYRSLRFLQGTPINHWPRGAMPDDDAPLARRIGDAHANCLENLPIFAVLVLVAATQGKLASIDALAACVFYCRVGQSLAHLWGTGSLQVLLRATFWAGQLALFVMMFLRLLA
jgi:uncharacterized MAPEG superfamily protein